MHDFHYFLYLGRFFIHMNIIIQVSQHSSIKKKNLSTTMLTSAFNNYTCTQWPPYDFFFCLSAQRSVMAMIIPLP